MRHGNYYEEKVPDYRMVIDINIQEQCELLRSQLKIELLTSYEANREIIKNFRSDKKGKGLERYLKEDAWGEDQQGITKVYLVKDSDNIVFFFALGAGVGFYVFWEIVVEKVLYIASILGCQYLYLFAADNSEQEYIQVSNLYPGDWEIDDEEDSQPVYKLVEYYKNELKFEDVQDVTILKPYYDFSCISLLQEISALSENRNAAWIQHSDVNN